MQNVINSAFKSVSYFNVVCVSMTIQEAGKMLDTQNDNISPNATNHRDFFCVFLFNIELIFNETSFSSLLIWVKYRQILLMSLAFFLKDIMYIILPVKFMIGMDTATIMSKDDNPTELNMCENARMGFPTFSCFIYTNISYPMHTQRMETYKEYLKYSRHDLYMN